MALINRGGALIPIDNVEPRDAARFARVGCKPHPRFAISSDFQASGDLSEFNRRGLIDKAIVNFMLAYAQACQAGWIKGGPFVPAGRYVRLHNAPDANTAGLYRSEPAADGTPGDLMFEYSFARDGVYAVPSVEEAKEAIFCHAVGVSAAEQQRSGRCLPD